MDLSEEIDGYLKESIDYALGLPVSATTLAIKLQASQESERRVMNQCLGLFSRLKQQDEIIERVRAESCMNAQSLKKFVEENQKLAAECSELVSQCSKWEKECSLYYRDREALMDFGNEADERAQNAEIRVHELEVEVKKLSDELKHYKDDHDKHNKLKVDSPTECNSIEENLLESFLTTLVQSDIAQSADAFLEANSGHESCEKLLKMWNRLKPSTQKVLSLAAVVKRLKKDKEHIRINLHRAEEEVKVLAEVNGILYKENKRLFKRCHEDKICAGSDGKHSSSTSVKRNKRKSSPKTISPIEKMMDLNDVDSTRYPFSALENKSPDYRMVKK